MPHRSEIKGGNVRLHVVVFFFSCCEHEIVALSFITLITAESWETVRPPTLMSSAGTCRHRHHGNKIASTCVCLTLQLQRFGEMHLITGLYRQQLDSVLKSRCWLCFVREGFKDGACLIVSDCLVVKVRLSSQQEGNIFQDSKTCFFC